MMTGKTYRNLARWIHIVAALLIGTYLYSPWRSEPIFSSLILWVAVPLLVVTGLGMWKQGWVMSWFMTRKN